LSIPDIVAEEVNPPRDVLLRDADLYVDLLCEGAPAVGASLLASRVSRYVVDLNRSPDDVDSLTVLDLPGTRPPQPRGVVWRVTTDGRPILRKPLTQSALERRLALFHRPYHEALQAELERLRERHGHAILLAAHSMPSVGRATHSDPGVTRADIVPGTRGGSTADRRLIDLVDHHFREAGLTVRHDEPYRGGFSTGHYGRPIERFHAIQIEMNRGLYVDEATAEPRKSEFDRLRALLVELVRKLVAYAF
jgi:N-formylglutamate amidohydrolase